MSLLLDALKRAGQEQESARPPLPPVEPGAARPAPPPQPARTPAGPSLASAAALAASRSDPPGNRRALWLAGGGLVLLLFAAAGFWLWYTLSFPPQPASPLVARPPLPPPPAAAPALPKAQPTPAAPAKAPGPGAPAAGAPALETPAVSGPEAAPPASAALAPPAASQPPAASPKAVARRQRERPEPASPEPTGPQVQRAAHPAEPAPNPEVTAGYTALLQGRLDEAEQRYRAALRADPLSADAELGLAAIAARRRDPVAAQAHYRRALEIDPKNGDALAGLAVVSDSVSESQLRRTAAAQPDSPSAWAALGMLYAGQSRWSDAQQAWFEAYRLDAASADAAYNLAVSLDHLGKGPLARDYYEKALTLAATRPAGFNPADAAARIEQLKR